MGQSAAAPDFNWRQPDYASVYAARNYRLTTFTENPRLLEAAKVHYRAHPWAFVSDWGMTYDPRRVSRGEPAFFPFVVWPRQEEYLRWVFGRWRAGERGLVEKSRDCGVTWLSIGFSVAMWLFYPGFAVGFGSRKEDLVDKNGEPDCIFEKVRYFIRSLPWLFTPVGFTERRHSSHMRVLNPENDASITGEAGANIGRGGRKSVYFVDEAAHVEHQDSVDAALSQTTDCQIDVSSVNGNGNLFYRKRQRFDGTPRLFIFDWRQDPRKDDAWYALQCEELDSEKVAQEIDRDYNASNQDAFIPAQWVASAMDAHKLLGIEPVGIRAAAFDPADVGDARAVIARHGSVVELAEEKRDGDITDAIPWAFELADRYRADVLGYDGDGMGAPSMKMALKSRSAGRVRVVAYHGSAGVMDPRERYEEPGSVEAAMATMASKRRDRRVAELHSQDAPGKSNADTFLNFRAQTWTWARQRFYLTHAAVERARKGQIINIDPELLISIDSECTKALELQAELSRPKRIWTSNGRIRVESKAEMKKREVESPNLADALVIAFSLRAPQQAHAPRSHVREQVLTDPAMGM